MINIDTNQLKSFLDEKHQGTVVCVLGPNRYEAAHIPGSVNVPLDAAEFVTRVGSYVENKDSTVIVYSEGPECDAAGNAARKLENSGYTDIRCYTPGIEGWREDGLPLRGEQISTNAS